MRNYSWRNDFPLRDEVEDFRGKFRIFVISCDEVGLGFTLRAKEQGAENGYEFAAYSETSPYDALGRLRQKMHRALAMRHISGRQGEYRMLHDSVAGRITSDPKGGTLLVVDGLPLTLEDLGKILESHEGWSFELRITDSLE